MSVRARSLIAELLADDPRKRLTATQALQRGWMAAPGEAVSDAPLAGARQQLQNYVARMQLPVRCLAPGEVLMREGEPATCCYYIVAGSAEVLVRPDDDDIDDGDGGDDDDRLVRIATVRRGEIVGEGVRRRRRCKPRYCRSIAIMTARRRGRRG